ncbi:pirin family protein [Sphingomonas sp. AP4-R1]|uniref:pirin family protein n=1 Tax=Sphingomonas sp. AP4-R1 TaxID=2735134 RepID=UPI001493BA48|nr:pirin family protein [Sphingomonas sp. AP4-R1]QJU58181.1 pirin family protein [Sphingomonas sp. AP4-R1]
MSDVNSPTGWGVLIARAATPRREGPATVNRALPGGNLPHANPFMALGEYIIPSGSAGFGYHPHRGVEMVTYQLDGTMEHREPDGTRLELPAGRAMHLFAGSGMVHSESPLGDQPSHGVQRWIALLPDVAQLPPRREAGEVPVTCTDGVTVRHVAGLEAAVRTEVQSLYLDISHEPGSSARHRLPRGWTAIVQILSGEAHIGDERRLLRQHDFAILTDGDHLFVETAEESVRYVLLGGESIGEVGAGDADANYRR